MADTGKPFTYISLCTGYGGLDEALELAIGGGNAFCLAMAEREAFACDILLNRMAEGSIKPCPIWSDLRTFPASRFRGLVDCVTGGYPCQPFSIAGRKGGADDPRHLWPAIARLLDEFGRPEWCVFENVANHLNLGFREVARDLQGMGYNVAAGLFTAQEVGASHKRERLFIVAHAPSDGCKRRGGNGIGTGRQAEPFTSSGTPVEHGNLQGLKARNSISGSGEPRFAGERRLDMGNSNGAERGPLGARDDGTGEGLNKGRQGASGPGVPSQVLGEPSSELHDRRGHAGPGGRHELADASGLVGDPDLAGPQGLCERSEEHAGKWFARQASNHLGHVSPELNLFAPGPADPRWEDLLVWRPELRPSLSSAEVESVVRNLADGSAAALAGPRTDQLRALGNGVVPLQAALAIRVLMADLLEYEEQLCAARQRTATSIAA